MRNKHTSDVLVAGSGAAGLATALHLANFGTVTVLSKDEIHGGSTNRAQGGVAAAIGANDSNDAHIADTLLCGAGLCNPDVVRFVVEGASAAISDLLDLGLEFDREGKNFHLSKEGGHRHRRVLHVADATGSAISSALLKHAKLHPNIQILTHRLAIDLIRVEPRNGNPRVEGAYVFNSQTNAVDTFAARFVVLATGGASKVYRFTSNPDGSTGDGIAMAWRAGCRVSNLEFNQFHPTCLYHPELRSFLISEAVRGEGGKLVLPNGERFMTRFDDRKELAPRDVVARAIDFEMKRLGIDCVYLDVTHLGNDVIEHRFPTILRTCLDVQMDMRKDPIPVVPAAHYTCGGVVVDRNGCADLPGLYAVGEAACTGLHGANRLASNSLLECLVFAKATAVDISKQLRSRRRRDPDIPDWDESQVTDSDEDVVLAHNWSELRRFMWNYVGIVRTDKRLQRAERRVCLLKAEAHEYYANYKVNGDLIELRNLIQVADLIVRSARWRRESRGLHFTLDYPESSRQARPSILTPPPSAKDPDTFAKRTAVAQESRKREGSPHS